MSTYVQKILCFFALCISLFISAQDTNVKIIFTHTSGAESIYIDRITLSALTKLPQNSQDIHVSESSDLSAWSLKTWIDRLKKQSINNATLQEEYTLTELNKLHAAAQKLGIKNQEGILAKMYCQHIQKSSSKHMSLSNENNLIPRNTHLHKAINSLLLSPYFLSLTQKKDMRPQVMSRFPISYIAISSGNSTSPIALARTGSNNIELWDLEKKNFILKGHHRPIRNLAWHPKNSTILGSNAAGAVKIWDLTSQTYTLYQSPKDISWMPSSSLDMLCAFDDSVLLWQPLLNKKFEVIKTDGETITSLASLKKNNTILYGTAHGDLNIKQLPPEEIGIHKSQAHHSAITALALLKEDIISGSDDGTIKLWNINLDCKRMFQAPSAILSLCSIGIYPEYFLSSQKNERPRLWSITQDTPIINTALDDLQRGSLVYSLGNTLIHTSSWANQLGMIEHLPIEGLSRLLSLPETMLLSNILQVKRGKKYPISAENEKKVWERLLKNLHENDYQGLRKLLKNCVAVHNIRTHKKVVVKTKAP